MTDEPTLADYVVERAAQMIADEVREEYRARFHSGDRIGALTLQSAALRATGTDGVVDLEAYRAARG